MGAVAHQKARLERLVQVKDALFDILRLSTSQCDRELVSVLEEHENTLRRAVREFGLVALLFPQKTYTSNASLVFDCDSYGLSSARASSVHSSQAALNNQAALRNQVFQLSRKYSRL